jgi:NAD(P)-dependent dehydrogenase (short-subunit alcohol dehydrogenase family)
VDVAVNNAATNPHFGPLLAADEGQVDKTLDTNLKGVFRGCKAVVPQMEKQGGGKIINIASVAGLRPGSGMGIYSISKAGVIMLTQVLAMELGPANIQVNAIAPGVIKTRFSQVLWQTPEFAESTLRSLPPGALPGLSSLGLRHRGGLCGGRRPECGRNCGMRGQHYYSTTGSTVRFVKRQRCGSRGA